MVIFWKLFSLYWDGVLINPKLSTSKAGVDRPKVVVEGSRTQEEQEHVFSQSLSTMCSFSFSVFLFCSLVRSGRPGVVECTLLGE